MICLVKSTNPHRYFCDLFICVCLVYYATACYVSGAVCMPADKAYYRTDFGPIDSHRKIKATYHKGINNKEKY